MRCDKCRRNGFPPEELVNYGGAKVCGHCYTIVNPPTTTYERLSDWHRKDIMKKMWEYETELRRMRQRLEIDDKVIASGNNKLTFTTSYYHAFKKP